MRRSIELLLIKRSISGKKSAKKQKKKEKKRKEARKNGQPMRPSEHATDIVHGTDIEITALEILFRTQDY